MKVLKKTCITKKHKTIIFFKKTNKGQIIKISGTGIVFLGVRQFASEYELKKCRKLKENRLIENDIKAFENKNKIKLFVNQDLKPYYILKEKENQKEDY